MMIRVQNRDRPLDGGEEGLKALNFFRAVAILTEDPTRHDPVAYLSPSADHIGNTESLGEPFHIEIETGRSL